MSDAEGPRYTSSPKPSQYRPIRESDMEVDFDSETDQLLLGLSSQVCANDHSQKNDRQVYRPITEPVTPVTEEEFDSETDQLLLGLSSQVSLTTTSHKSAHPQDRPITKASTPDVDQYFDSETDEILKNMELPPSTPTKMNDTWDGEPDIDDLLRNIKIPGSDPEPPKEVSSSQKPAYPMLRSLLEKPSLDKEVCIVFFTLRCFYTLQ